MNKNLSITFHFKEGFIHVSGFYNPEENVDKIVINTSKGCYTINKNKIITKIKTEGTNTIKSKKKITSEEIQIKIIKSLVKSFGGDSSQVRDILLKI